MYMYFLENSHTIFYTQNLTDNFKMLFGCEYFYIVLGCTIQSSITIYLIYKNILIQKFKNHRERCIPIVTRVIIFE